MPVMPRSLNDFVELVVPELQRRGLFRTEYKGNTLRERMGLEIPVNSHFAKSSLAASNAKMHPLITRRHALAGLVVTSLAGGRAARADEPKRLIGVIEEAIAVRY